MNRRRSRHNPPPNYFDFYWPQWKRRTHGKQGKTFIAPISQSLADTMTFTQVEDQGANLLDTLTFSHTFGSPELNAALSDTVRFGGGVRIDTSDLAGGRFRY